MTVVRFDVSRGISIGECFSVNPDQRPAGGGKSHEQHRSHDFI